MIPFPRPATVVHRLAELLFCSFKLYSTSDKLDLQHREENTIQKQFTLSRASATSSDSSTKMNNGSNATSSLCVSRHREMTGTIKIYHARQFQRIAFFTSKLSRRHQRYHHHIKINVQSNYIMLYKPDV